MPLFERDPSVAFAAKTRGELQLRRLAGAVVGQIGGYADWLPCELVRRSHLSFIRQDLLRKYEVAWLRLCKPLSDGSIVFHVLCPTM